jgi:hypothetical protein
MSAFQGYDIKLNLVETVSDRDALNNLGGTPIADDISLFVNNLRNTSVLLVTAEQISGSYIEFNPLAQVFVYTNGTKVTVGSNTYYVGDSNNVNRFRLYTDQSLASLVQNPPLGNYLRTDAISFEDIAQLSPQRDRVVDDVSLSKITDRSNIDLYDSFIRVYNQINNSSDTLVSYVNSIRSGIDIFNINKENAISGVKDFSTSNKISLSGNILVVDPDGVNDQGVSSSENPGIFILDLATDQPTRIFSSNENVWQESGSDLVADTEEIVVANFIFNDGVRINRKNNNPAIVEETGTVTSYTHFVPVKINGEDYFLCLKS